MKDGKEEIIDLRLHEKTLDLMNDIPENLPSWTKINFHQCPHCPLDIQKYTYCPIAVHLVKINELLKSLLSYDEIHVDIMTPQRHVSRETSAQKGVSSLMGLIMATSGCPHMNPWHVFICHYQAWKRRSTGQHLCISSRSISSRKRERRLTWSSKG